MQKLKGTRHPATVTWGHILSLSTYTVGLLIVIIGGALLLHSSSSITKRASIFPGTRTMPETVAMNGADLWDADTTTTAPSFDFSPPGTGTGKVAVSPLFAEYYTTHHGVLNLGSPVTVAFPTNQGWIQFFELDALLSPAVQLDHPFDKEDPLRALAASPRDAQRVVTKQATKIF